MTGDVVTRLVVSYNSAEVLAWQAEHSASLPTIVVDNASTDGSAERAEELGLRVLRMPANAGYGRAIMAGLALVESEYALILNPDTTVDQASVDALIDAGRRYGGCDLFVPRVLDDAGRERYRVETSFEPRQRDRRPPTGEACVPVISGAAMFVRVRPFREFGGFDPAIFLYFEEDELCFRYRAAKRPMIYVPAAKVVHLRDRSSTPDGGRTSRLKDVSFGWSLAYVMRRHGRGSRARTFAAMLLKVPVYAVSGRRQRLRRQVVRIGGFIKALRGEPAPFMPPEH